MERYNYLYIGNTKVAEFSTTLAKKLVSEGLIEIHSCWPTDCYNYVCVRSYDEVKATLIHRGIRVAY